MQQRKFRIWTNWKWSWLCFCLRLTQPSNFRWWKLLLLPLLRLSSSVKQNEELSKLSIIYIPDAVILSQIQVDFVGLVYNLDKILLWIYYLHYGRLTFFLLFTLKTAFIIVSFTFIRGSYGLYSTIFLPDQTDVWNYRNWEKISQFWYSAIQAADKVRAFINDIF